MTATDANGSAGPARAFPDGFLWGVSSSAYQIEGATTAGGRGQSVWDTFSHTPGKVRGGDTGDVACDFYNRHQQDLDLIKELGFGAFRFSVAWPRVQPDGDGASNQLGLDFYRSLVEGLQARGIVPVLTLYHWDLPQALEDRGGWASRDTAERFAEYAGLVAEGIGDTGGPWITLNEPQVAAHQGYRIGTHAPGHVDDALAAAATHHLLLGHGLAVERIRSVIPAASVGIALDMHAVRTLDPECEEAAAIADAETNGIFTDPLLRGRYPEKARAHLLPPASLVHDGDMEQIAMPLDFVGVNYYSPNYLKRADAGGLQAEETPIAGTSEFVLFKPRHLARTAMGWLVEPDSLYDTLVAVAAELPPGCRLYVTENGCAAEDYVNPDGVVDDFERIDYMRGHLDAAWRAIQDGVPLDGYFHWALHDNFEWACGYQKRFGLVFVEYDTQRRIPKRSASYYGTIASTNALPDGEDLLTPQASV